jgi:hypothetical protein
MRKSKTSFLISTLVLILVLAIYLLYFFKSFKVPESFKKQVQEKKNITLYSNKNIKETFVADGQYRRHSKFLSQKSTIVSSDGLNFFETHEDLEGLLQIKCFIDAKTNKPMQHLYAFKSPDGLFDFNKNNLELSENTFALYAIEGHTIPHFLQGLPLLHGISKTSIFSLHHPMQFNTKRLQMTLKK